MIGVLVFLPRSWIFCYFVPRTPRIFFDFSPWSRKLSKNLPCFVTNNGRDFSKKSRKFKNFLGKTTKISRTGSWQRFLNFFYDNITHIELIQFEHSWIFAIWVRNFSWNGVQHSKCSRQDWLPLLDDELATLNEAVFSMTSARLLIFCFTH